jgi:hypothetical protein
VKRRLLFSAFAFLGLAFAAYWLSSSARDDNREFASQHPLASSPSAPAHAAEDSPNDKTATVPQKRGSASTSSSAAIAVPSETAALGELQSNSKRAWNLKRDDFSNRIRTLSGGELESKTLVARQAGDDFVRAYSQGLFGVDPARVRFNREEVTDRTRLVYDQVVDGIAVYGASLTLFIENGSLTRVQNDLAPLEVDSTSNRSRVEDAFSTYRSVQSAAYDVRLQDHSANRVVLYTNRHALS